MTRYSVRLSDRIFVKDHGFLCFAKNMSQNIGKDISKNICGKYRQKLFDHVKQSDTDALKTTSKRVIQKTVEATGDLIGNMIADKITKIWKISLESNSETVKIEIKMPEEEYIPPKKRQQVINNLRYISNSIITEYQKIINLLDNT